MLRINVSDIIGMKKNASLNEMKKKEKGKKIKEEQEISAELQIEENDSQNQRLILLKQIRLLNIKKFR